MSNVAIVLVVWFTSTSWRRDQISEPYRLPIPIWLIRRWLVEALNDGIVRRGLTYQARGRPSR